MLQDSARYALYLIRGIGIEPLRDTIINKYYPVEQLGDYHKKGQG